MRENLDITIRYETDIKITLSFSPKVGNSLECVLPFTKEEFYSMLKEVSEVLQKIISNQEYLRKRGKGPHYK